MMIPKPTRLTKIVRKIMTSGRVTSVETFYTITPTHHEISSIALEIREPSRPDVGGGHRHRARADASARSSAAWRYHEARNSRHERDRRGRPALLGGGGHPRPAAGRQRHR